MTIGTNAGSLLLSTQTAWRHASICDDSLHVVEIQPTLTLQNCASDAVSPLLLLLYCLLQVLAVWVIGSGGVASNWLFPFQCQTIDASKN